MSTESRSDSGTDRPFAPLLEALGDVREAVERAERVARDVERASEEGAHAVPEQVAPQWTWRSKLWACPSEVRLGVQEATEALGVSPSWIYSRTKSDADDPLPFRKLGGTLYFVAGELRHWIRTHEEAPVQGPSWSPSESRVGLVKSEGVA